MIKATGSKSTGFTIEATEKIGGKTMQLHVADEAEMIRIAYFWNRLYICEKMCNYLKQRAYALNLVRQYRYANQATLLLQKIEVCSKSSFTDLCDRIVQNAAVIRLVAPSPKSAEQYSFYQNTICGIVAFCEEMSKGAQLRAIAEPEGVEAV